MGKKLSELTKEELWQLFPICLTEHQDEWRGWYEEEKELLRSILPEEAVKSISHIGSTAVTGIWAKPIIDILVETAQGRYLKEIKEILLQNGYLCMAESGSRISFNKGYTENGFAQRVFHLHLRREGDHDELYFRDYLLAHPETAREYEALKLNLWKQFEHDRDGYTESKTEFIHKYTEIAKREKSFCYDGGIEYRKLCAEEIHRELFRDFVRYQKVEDCYRKINGQWVIRKDPFVDDWSEEDYEFLTDCLKNTVRTGGVVYGAFEEGRLKGFASVEGIPLGTRKQYLDLSSIHVSLELRGRGTGRRLFLLAACFAREHGAEKLYISAHSAVESQAFYKAMGCVEAEEYQKEHVEKEPYDCQLEYGL